LQIPQLYVTVIFTVKKVILSNTQRELLTTITHGSTSPQRLVLRCNIILAGAETSNQTAIANDAGIDRNTVRLWLVRWQDSSAQLDHLEAEHAAGRLTTPMYQRALADTLDDAPRPGAPCTYTEEDKQKIIALASEEPEKAGVPVTNWTYTLITQAVIDKGIVKHISRARIGHFLKESRLKATS
jgi:hypothetical protein